MDELRARLRRVEEDAAAARILAGGADRDVGEIRTELRELRSEMRSEFADVRAEMRDFRDQNNRVLSAMRADVVDLRAHMDERFARGDERLAEIRGLLDGQAAWNQKLADMLGVLVRQRHDDPTDRS
jgi:predicted  nucleic acid-binding Zn-ribbon protein